MRDRRLALALFIAIIFFLVTMVHRLGELAEVADSPHLVPTHQSMLHGEVGMALLQSHDGTGKANRTGSDRKQ